MLSESFLSNELIFPLLSYSEMGGLILFVTPFITKFNYDYGVDNFQEKHIIDPSFNNKKTRSRCSSLKEKDQHIHHHHNISLRKLNTYDFNKNEPAKNSKRDIQMVINDYSNIDQNSIYSINLSNIVNKDIELNHYSRFDLENSKILNKIDSNHLIKVIDELSIHPQFKFMIINARDLIPNLFDIDNESTIRILSIDQQTKIKKQTTINKTQICNAQEIIEKEYNISLSSSLEVIENSFNSFQYKLIYNPQNNQGTNTIMNDFFVNLMFLQNDILTSKIKESKDLQSMFNITNLSKIIQDPNIVLYSLRYSIKQKYSLIKKFKKNSNNHLSDSFYYIKCNFANHFENFCEVLNQQSFNIRTIQHLKETFIRYGINFNMQLFTLPKIQNNELASLIKISLFGNVIKDFMSFHESSNLMLKMFLYENTHEIDYLKQTSFNFHQSKDLKTQALIQKGYTINEIKKEKIYYLIKAILYPSEVSNQQYLSFVYEQMSFFLMIKTFKWKIIDESLGFDLFKTQPYQFQFEVKNLLTEFTKVAREYPFIFLTTLENVLQIIISPFIKYKASLSLHSLANNGLQLNDIILNDPIVTSYIKPKEISGYILAKFISVANSFNQTSENKHQILQQQVNPIHTPGVFKAKINIQQYLQYNSNLTKNEMNNASIRMNSNNLTKINQFNNTSISYIIDGQDKNGTHTKELESNYFTWKDIAKSYTITLPSICYKLLYGDEDETNYKDKSIYKNLSHTYSFDKFDCISDWKNTIETMLYGISSSNGDCESSLMHIYILYFINMFYIDKNILQAKEVLLKMKEIMKTSQMFTYNICAIFNLLDALVTEKYIESEEYYSKSLIFSLFQYGDPRGRRNQGHTGMMYPLWKIARQTCALENSLTNENFKEMFHCLNNNSKENIYHHSLYNKQLNYTENQNKNIALIIKVNEATKETTVKDINNPVNGEIQNINDDENESIHSQQNDIHECPSFNYFQDKNYYSSKIIIFNDINNIKPFSFPSTSDIKSSYIKQFHNKEFTLFILNSLMSMISDHGCLINEEILTISSMNFIPQLKEIRQNNTSSPSLTKKKNGTILSHYIFCELMEKMSYKNNPPDGIMISFGKNDHNETTHDNYEMLSLPRVAYKMKDIEIEHVIAGWEHNFIIDNKGDCYGWGRNQYGQCGIKQGHGSSYIINNPKKVLFEDTIKINHISCGNEHSLFVSTTGDVYATGNSEDGVIGIQDKLIQYTPIKIKGLSNIISVACGTVHNLALDIKGKVYSWGSSRGGQLGLSEQYIISQGSSIYLTKPTQISIQPKIIQIASGEAHSFALTDSGDVYGWGFSSNGQLGLGFCADSFESGMGLVKSRVILPTIINTLPQISNVQCGKIFSMFLTKNNEILSCGGNDVHQLGIEDEPSLDHLYEKACRCFDFVIPTPIEYFMSMKVIQVSCGESHCLSIIYDPLSQLKTVWSWGNNRFGQLGLGKQIKSSSPKPINYLLGYCNSQIAEISCGGFHSLCLFKSKIIYNSQKDEELIVRLINNSIFNRI